MPEYQFTNYFETKVLIKRTYLRKEFCIQVIERPLRVQREPTGRFRFWGRVEELGARYLRVVTLEDRRTIHNAFLDRRFRP